MNLAGIISTHPADALALVHRGRRVTFGELRSEVSLVRTGLSERGVATGDRVAIVCPAGPEFVVAYLAILGLGSVAVPLNPQSPAIELERELATVRSVAVVGASGEDSAMAAARRIGHPVFTVSDLGELRPTMPRASAEPVSRGQDGSYDYGLVDRSPDDPAALLFTSGTAGFPKAAVLTHGSLLANIEQMELRVGTAATSSDVALLLIPLFHIFGLNAVLGVQLYVGGVTVIEERFDPATTLALAVAEHVTILPAVPQVFAALACYEAAGGDELCSLRLAVSGAAPLASEIAASFESRYGVQLWQGYGLTEASPAVTFPDTGCGHDASTVGMPLPGVEVKVVDDDGEPVEPGDPGEILVRGPNVFAGYFENPKATSAILDAAGWLHTGDVAVMGESGELRVVDRQKDLIIVSGFNVFPAEVEQVLERHPRIDRAAVVGVADDAHGEAVRAFVVPHAELWADGEPGPAGLSETDVRKYCLLHLARYKCPTDVAFVRALPTSIHGKALRRGIA